MKRNKSEARAGAPRQVAESPVEFPNASGKWLRGMIHRPRVSSLAPGVVFFHGFTGDRMESHWIFIRCARSLARAGIASLRFDFYGSGESEGEFREATLEGEIADARRAVEFFRRQKGIDARRLGIVGLSLGGAIAALVAQPARAGALVLWSALAHPRLLRQLAETHTRPIPERAGAVEYDAREIAPDFLNQAERTEPLESIVRFQGPTLIIHPEKDEYVPAAHAEDFYRAAGARVKEKVIVAGADHTFTSAAWEGEVVEQTVEWFKKWL